MSDKRDTKFWIGFFIGGLIGAVVLFLMGTKEGKKTKKLFSERGHDFIAELEDKLGELEKKGKELAKEGQVIKDQVIETIEEKKEVLTDGATEKLDTALAHIEKLQEQGLETTSTLRKKLFKNIPKKSR